MSISIEDIVKVWNETLARFTVHHSVKAGQESWPSRTRGYDSLLYFDREYMGTFDTDFKCQKVIDRTCAEQTLAYIRQQSNKVYVVVEDAYDGNNGSITKIRSIHRARTLADYTCASYTIPFAPEPSSYASTYDVEEHELSG